MTTTDRHAYVSSPEEVANAFYDAFQRANIDAMMSVWAEDEEIVCVHPGAHPLTGYAAVRAAWKSVFESSPAFRFELTDVVWHTTGAMATQTCVEWIRLGDDTQPRGGVAATNTFIRTIHGWRLLGHHGSPIAQQSGNTGVTVH
jgi:ketosteroid isomerase-like protein